MNQSPKKNKYIIKNQKLCSIPFLAIQPSSNTRSAHGKRLCSRQHRRLHVQLGTYTGKTSAKVEPQATGGLLDAKFLYLGERHPPGSQLSASHWWALTQELFNLVLFGKYRLNTRGLSQSLALGRGAGSMKGVHVTHGSGSKFSYQCLLDVLLKLRCLAPLAVLFGTSLANQLFNCSPCLSTSSLEEGREQGGFLRTEMVLGRPWRTSPMFMLYWKTVQKGILHQKPQTMFDQSPAAGSETP